MTFKALLFWVLSLSLIGSLLNFQFVSSPEIKSQAFLSPDSPPSPQIDLLYDENTLSNINEVRAIHYHLSLSLDFEQQTLSGINAITLSSLIPNLTEVHFDVRNLVIIEIYDEHHTHLSYQIEANPLGDESIGDRLRIKLQQKPKLFTPFNIFIVYRTNPNATALNWLTPEQTSSKTQPYLFSQCESIHCRTVAPLQDTPAIKSTYSANITVPSNITVFMSANQTGKYQLSTTHSTYQFLCSIPIPSYLIAIVAGNITQQQISERTFVISEPNDLPAFSKELEDLEKYLITVENYITPYAWGSYKIVILPPSFPFGGMENPLLTFASPSIIAGDKSGVFVVIHEIGHSWTGNWVTCQNWQNFWLNEGFTVFLERKGGFLLNGRDFYAISAIVGNISLMEDMKTYGFNDSFSSLHPELKGKNPDDAFSEVPYEKGFQFLVYLESLVGELNFQKLLREYVTKFANKSPVYEEFATFFTSFVVNNLENSSDILGKVDWESWIWTPGMPPVDMSVYFTNEVVKEADKLANDFIAGKGEIIPNNSGIFKDFNMNVKLLFLQHFVDRFEDLNEKVFEMLNNVYALDNNTNSEVAFLWWKLNILIDNQKSFDLVEIFLGKTGRMKFVRPLFVALNLKNHDLAVRIFRKYENFYHPIAVRLIKQDLNIQ